MQNFVTEYCDVCYVIFSQLKDLKTEMTELEKYDTLQVVKRRQANECVKEGLQPTSQPTQPPHGNTQNHTAHQSVEIAISVLFYFHWKPQYRLKEQFYLCGIFYIYFQICSINQWK